MLFQRSSGILLHPTSFPSQHGIGDLGKSAYEFIDFLQKSGYKLWQILPLGPTGEEHSPYIMNYSTFAGNPLMISLEELAQEGLLELAEIIPLETQDSSKVNFEAVVPHKTLYLKKAYASFQQQLEETPNPTFVAFCQKHASWLDDYALFMALLEAHEGQSWNYWEPGLAHRDPEALKAKAEVLKASITYQKFLQFTFFKQWEKLRQYANQKGIKIIGDISIYVCYNSVEVWSNPNLFQLNSETLEPIYIAGVPPDFFSETGQLWGNPIYNWEELQNTKFAWWIERFKATLEYADYVRIDHFRAFEAYWRVPGSEKNAINGEWIKAPGYEFFDTLKQQLGDLPVLAEDLGIITPEVEQLRDHYHFPGMKILQFAFGGDANSVYLPHNYISNCLVYTGTHDNDTTIGWWETASATEKQHFAEYLGYTYPDEITNINWVMIRLALSSLASLAIIPLQDVLDLGHDSRMNDPSHNDGNWRWRYQSSELLTQELSDRLLKLNQLYSR
ncbi:MAG: 4-alpha-glucanotransferase [Oscillatoriales cyanobacterium CG2_30_40_61]|nr:MAG: 4-alpha-glucanotransferase [Oscillatoriales cyanobacterium CG2_30_40_61]